ncbi:MAG: AAA family ATPase [Clostridiaceae bacterium]|nr:AAA family ATPase [Clostridiaceae bacterium]
MRPRYLEIEGLQSFKQVQRVDFDFLGETGLFGIFGPTGSGKSTVLDAITLALYGKVSRANMGTQGIINTDSSRVKVVFRFDLLRGCERKMYRVERIYVRKKGSDISCEAKLARLVEERGDIEIPVADKLSDVNVKIEELLGLTHDDFTRAVVLPQNKFHEFLLMNRGDKRKMLERIFYLEEYGKQLNSKLAKKVDAVKLELSNLGGALSTLGDASRGALVEAEREFREAEAAKDTALEEYKKAAKEYEEAKEIRQYVQEMELVKQKMNEHLAGLEAVNKKKNLIEKATRAEGLAGMINSYRDTSERLQDAQKQLELVLGELPGIKEELEKARKHHEKYVEYVEHEKPRLLENKNALANALEIRREVEQLENKARAINDRIKETGEKESLKEKETRAEKEKISSIEEEINKRQRQAENLKVNPEYKNEVQKAVNLENELASAKRNLDGLKKKEEELTSRINNLEGTLAGIGKDIEVTIKNLELLDEKLAGHEKSKPAEREELTRGMEECLKLKAAVETIKSKEADLDAIRARISDRMKEVEKYGEELKKAQLHRQHVKEEMEKKSRQVKDLRKRVEQDAACMLSKKLIEGEPCPVCGSPTHPAPAFKQVERMMGDFEHTFEHETEEKVRGAEDMLRDAEIELEKAEAAFMEAEKACIEISGYMNNARARLEQEEKDALTKKNELEKQRFSSLPQEMQALPAAEIEKEIEKTGKTIEEKKRELERWEKRLEAINDNIKKGKDILNNHRINESGTKSQLEANMEMFRQVKGEMAELLKAMDEKEKIYMAFLNKYGIKSANSELEHILKNEKEIDKLTGEIKKLKELEKAAREKLEMLQEEVRQLSSQLAVLKANYGNTGEMIKEREDRFTKILQGSVWGIGTGIDAAMSAGTNTKIEAAIGTGIDTAESSRIDMEAGAIIDLGINDLGIAGPSTIGPGNIDTGIISPGIGTVTGMSARDIEGCMAAIEKEIQEMGKKEKELSELARKLEEQYNNGMMRKNTLENQVEIFRETLGKESQRLESALEEKGFTGIPDVENSMLDKDSREALKNEIDEYERTERNLSAQVTMLLNKLGGRGITGDEWNRAEESNREKLQAKDNAITRYEVARSNLERIRKKHEEWVVLSTRNDELSRKADILEQIKGLLRGNSFIDYVAEERMRYIAREASETLGILTRYRYALELDPDVGFVIRDDANGGVCRMVNSLSGGETFITSLCLALALSKQIQLKGQSPLEFFFLDEGFGTLDRELLDIVIDALERLSTKERVIGVISHVPEMKQRITRRLVVEPPTAEGLGSRLRIERA